MFKFFNRKIPFLKAFPSNFYPLSLLIGLFLGINAMTLYSYMIFPYILGWDGMGHAAVAYTYHNQIFPHIFGTLSAWFNGMPFSHFYPPLFYMVTSLLAFAKDQQTFFILFKIFIILLFIITIIVFYYLSLQLLKSKNRALISSVFFILIISSSGKINDLGVSIDSVFVNGLLPQSFSFIFLLIFILYSNKVSTIKNRVLMILSLVCVTLSNIHVLFVTIFYITVYSLYLLINKQFAEFKTRFIDYIFAGFLSLFWFLPMLSYYKFSSAKAIGFTPGDSLYIDAYLIISIFLSVVAFKYAFKEKSTSIQTLSIYTFFISISNYLPISKLAPILPFHTKRWLIISILTIPILAMYAVNRFKYSKTVCSIVLIYIASVFIFSIKNQSVQGFYKPLYADSYEEMLDYLSRYAGTNSLISVESNFGSKTYDFFFTHALLGMNNVPTTYAILRESSAISFAFASIRNSISMDNERWGINFNLTEDNLKERKLVKQGIEMGITHFIVESEKSKNILSKNKLLELEKNFGTWDIYRVIKPVEKVSDHDLKTILTYTDFSLKKNTSNQFDLIRIAEELIYNDDMDLIFYKSNANDLSEKVTYLDASAVLITTYNYSNLDKAYENIIQMSETRPVFLIEDRQNPLYQKVLPHADFRNNNFKKNIHIIKNIYYPIGSKEYHQYYQDNFDDIRYETTGFETDKFKYIRKTYLPGQKSSHVQYIATPFYTLESKTDLAEEKWFDIITFSKYISLLSGLTMCLYFIGKRRKYY